MDSSVDHSHIQVIQGAEAHLGPQVVIGRPASDHLRPQQERHSETSTEASDNPLIAEIDQVEAETFVEEEDSLPQINHQGSPPRGGPGLVPSPSHATPNPRLVSTEDQVHDSNQPVPCTPGEHPSADDHREDSAFDYDALERDLDALFERIDVTDVRIERSSSASTAAPSSRRASAGIGPTACDGHISKPPTQVDVADEEQESDSPPDSFEAVDSHEPSLYETLVHPVPGNEKVPSQGPSEQSTAGMTCL